MASLTWYEAGDRLRALGDLVTRYLPNGTVVIENNGTVDLNGVTLAVPIGQAEIILEGAPLADTRKEAGRTTVWLSLQKGAQVKLSVTVAGRKVPFLSLRPATLEAL